MYDKSVPTLICNVVEDLRDTRSFLECHLYYSVDCSLVALRLVAKLNK